MSERNPARPAPGAELCPLEQIAPNSAIVLRFAKDGARFSMLVARGPADDVSAYENVCPHALSALERADGRVLVQQQRFIVCAAHGASFRLSDGYCVAGPGLGLSLRPLPVTLLSGVIYAA